MEYRIVSKNNYLRITLAHIIRRTRSLQSIGIIDITSSYSLREILDYVERYKTSSLFIFIGDNGVYSRALLPLISVDSKEPISLFSKSIRSCPGVSYDKVMAHLLTIKNMKHFTNSEKTIVFSLLINDSLTEAARHNGISIKLFYQRLDNLSKKINMINRIQVHQFFRHEYSPIFVREIQEARYINSTQEIVAPF